MTGILLQAKFRIMTTKPFVSFTDLHCCSGSLSHERMAQETPKLRCSEHNTTLSERHPLQHDALLLQDGRHIQLCCT